MTLWHCPFQSRSGFSLRRDETESVRRRTDRSSFNPGLGFLSVATVGTWRAISAIRFQSRSGFSLRRDRTVAGGGGWVDDVSIPVWVFSPSRPRGYVAEATTLDGFNPGLGFLSVATRPPEFRRRSSPVFQSRSGFSLRRDPTRCPCHEHGRRFNPGLGFLSVATALRLFHSSMSDQFQSRSGFSLRRDRIEDEWTGCRWRPFQSRSGFSLRRDLRRRARQLAVRPVSIPVWVFSPSRPARQRWSESLGTCFNPGLGFLSVATPRPITAG